MTKQNKDKICKQNTIAQKNIAIIDNENKKNINLNKNLNKKIILASGSQGRLEVLQKMFIKPDYIIVPNIPEPIIKREKPRDMSIRVAKAKADKALEMVLSDEKISKHSIIIVGDTVACCGNMILDKTKNDDDVRKCLQKMNGRGTRIYSTTCIIDIETGRRSLKTAEARLKMRYLQPDEIDFYISTKQGIGKAGGYAIGQFACCLFEKIIGEYTTIIGLPAVQVYNTLRSFGYKFQIPSTDK
jgi:septum formation protein